MPKIMLDEPVSKFTNHDITAISGEFKVNDAAEVMVEDNIDSVLVFEGNLSMVNEIGTITNPDTFPKTL